MPATVVANTVNILFICIPPAQYVCGAENAAIIEIRFTEVKMERQIKMLDLII
jgi:hypothetical protein